MNALFPIVVPDQDRFTPRARNFLAANQESRVVYCSVEAGSITYRLENDRTFRLSRAEGKMVGHGRWAHLQP